MNIKEYYGTPAVRSRVIEFLGGRTLDDATCFYIGRPRDTIHPGFNMAQPRELHSFMDKEWDVARSLWDRVWLIVDLDIEYTNFEFPAEPFLDYRRTFALQRPVFLAVQRILSAVDIQPLHAISGRGHHFVWKAPIDSPACDQLVDIGRLTPTLERQYTTRQPPDNVPVGVRLGKAFSGLGLIMEYVAYRILQESQEDCPIPVYPEAVDFGPQQRGKEMICVDISEYGDPLHTRGMRTPFSIYLKPWQYTNMLDSAIRAKLPIMVMVPRDDLEVEEAVEIMRDMSKAAELATRTECLIPDCSRGLEDLTSLYLHSDLREFHDEYYSQEHDPVERWPFTYDRTPTWRYPPYIRYILEHPNDSLLSPGPIRQLIAFLLNEGWHPRHIAGLIRSKYERNYGWLNQWYVYDAGMRADYHTRVMAGLMKLGLDHLADQPVGAH
ncbi:MAG: hypothetical protein ACM3VT_08695 [Solirubrobacterales bacterium]